MLRQQANKFKTFREKLRRTIRCTFWKKNRNQQPICSLHYLNARSPSKISKLMDRKVLLHVVMVYCSLYGTIFFLSIILLQAVQPAAQMEVGLTSKMIYWSKWRFAPSCRCTSVGIALIIVAPTAAGHVPWIATRDQCRWSALRRRCDTFCILNLVGSYIVWHSWS